MASVKNRVYKKKFSEQEVLDAVKNCRIYPSQSKQIISGEVNLLCNDAKIIGKSHQSYKNVVASYGNCIIDGESTKGSLTGDARNFDFDEGEVLLSNIEGLNFRLRREEIRDQNFQSKIKKIKPNHENYQHFSCGCIIDDKKFKKESENKYIQSLVIEQGVFTEEKKPFTQWYPISWVEKFVEVNDQIFGKGKYWTSESDYQSKRSILNRDERSKFILSGDEAIGCAPIKQDEVIASSSEFVKSKIESNGPYISSENKLLKGKNKENLICQIKSVVPAIYAFKIGEKEIKKGTNIPISDAKDQFGDLDFHFSVKSYYDPNDVSNDFVRQGFQCKGSKNAMFNRVSMNLSNPNDIQ